VGGRARPALGHRGWLGPRPRHGRWLGARPRHRRGAWVMARVARGRRGCKRRHDQEAPARHTFRNAKSPGSSVKICWEDLDKWSFQPPMECAALLTADERAWDRGRAVTVERAFAQAVREHEALLTPMPRRLSANDPHAATPFPA